jgi:hypothetical protein
VIRFLLLLAALGLGVSLVAAHGVRGLLIAVVLLVAVSAPRTRTWRTVEYYLVRLTGSRRRAAVLALSVVLVLMVSVDIYEFVH